MRIDRIILREIDPLKILTEKTLIRERDQNEEQNEDEEDEREENRRITEIWENITKDTEDSRPSPIMGFFNLGPNLHELATLLNRSDVQIILADLLEGEKKDPEKREKARTVRRNLKALNGKIDRANSVWFRHLPLVFRVFRQIEKIRIPR